MRAAWLAPRPIGEAPLPEWTLAYDVQHLWAPDAVLIDGVVHVYYSASSFGSNRSAIGLTTSGTPEDLASWEDLGPVVTSRPSGDHNAIDPDLVHVDGTWSLARRPGVEHNPIEAPTIFFRDGWFYLLTSWDACCRGTDSTYRIAVGRAEEITGPYVDADGVRLDEGGGTVILASEGAQVGPGGQDVMEEDGRHYLVHHYYDGDAGGTIRMQVRQLGWRDGWPHVEG